MSDRGYINLKEYVDKIVLHERELREQASNKQDKAVSAAFEASEKAIVKAEIAQQAYNARSNEFRAALDDQAKLLLPRAEADTRFEQLRDLIDLQGQILVELQKSDSRNEGSNIQDKSAKTNSQWTIGTIITIVIAVLTGVGSLIFFLATKN